MLSFRLALSLLAICLVNCATNDVPVTEAGVEFPSEETDWWTPPEFVPEANTFKVSHLDPPKNLTPHKPKPKLQVDETPVVSDAGAWTFQPRQDAVGVWVTDVITGKVHFRFIGCPKKE